MYRQENDLIHELVFLFIVLATYFIIPMMVLMTVVRIFGQLFQM